MMKQLRTAAWVAVICVVAAYGGWWLAHQGLLRGTPENFPAPDLELTDLKQQTHRISSYRGKLLLINFWASWCSPCVDEMPLLVEAQKAYASRGLQIIGPALDDADAAGKMAAQLGVTYPVMVDFSQVDAAMKAFGNSQGALPYSVLISPDGLVLESMLGGIKRAELEHLLNKHLSPS